MTKGTAYHRGGRSNPELDSKTMRISNEDYRLLMTLSYKTEKAMTKLMHEGVELVRERYEEER